jgi:hypothetical protein
MKAVLIKMSDVKQENAEIVEVNSIEDLLKIQKDSGFSLIISDIVDIKYNGIVDFSIDIYDEYGE